MSVDVRMQRFWRSYYMRYDWMRHAPPGSGSDRGRGRVAGMGSGGGGVEAAVECCVSELVDAVCGAHESDEERQRLLDRVEQLEALVSMLQKQQSSDG